MKNNTNGRGEMRRNVRRMVNISIAWISLLGVHVIYKTIDNSKIDWTGISYNLAAAAAIATGPLVSKAMQKKHEPPFNNNAE